MEVRFIPDVIKEDPLAIRCDGEFLLYFFSYSASNKQKKPIKLQKYIARHLQQLKIKVERHSSKSRLLLRNKHKKSKRRRAVTADCILIVNIT